MSAVALLNDSLLSVMLRLGERTGLLDRLAQLPPSRSDEIARAAALDERHVRHWLGAMVTAGVLDYDGARGRYQLAGAVEDAVLDRFRHGGPIARRTPPLIGAALDRVRIAVGRAVLTAPGDLELIAAFHGMGAEAGPPELFASIRAALRPGGTFVGVDLAVSANLADNVDHPLGPTLYATAALQGAPLWGEEDARRMLAEAGFRDVAVTRIEGDVFGLYYVAR